MNRTGQNADRMLEIFLTSAHVALSDENHGWRTQTESRSRSLYKSRLAMLPKCQEANVVDKLCLGFTIYSGDAALGIRQVVSGDPLHGRSLLLRKCARLAGLSESLWVVGAGNYASLPLT
jgi:hypothetical protein